MLNASPIETPGISSITSSTNIRVYIQANGQMVHVPADKLFSASLSKVSLRGSATINLPSIATLAWSAAQTITVTGAAVGDSAQVTFVGDALGLLFLAHINAANTVSFRAFNPTGAAVDLASGSFIAFVEKQ